ncbi:MAG: cystathionine gamma-synthase [Chloroflexi bacterium]|nr:cystathionine gamma-synthase [Chloroflexota bacterium]
MRIETLAIHAGQQADPATGAIMTPIYQTSTYVQAGVGEHKGYDYSRTANPTRAALEACLAGLEGGKYGLAFSSGMAAIDTLLRLVASGEHVVAGNDVYGGTFRLFDRVLKPYGLQFSFVDTSDLGAVRAALRHNTRLIWLETPTNPRLRLADIAGVAQLARQHPSQPWVGVDNTFASPYLQQPLALGADFVAHSTTKYLGGHSDLVGGALLLNDETAYERLKFLQNAIGAVPGPMDCFLVLRGVKTLPVRMERHGQNAQAVAEFLSDHPAVERVMYPGLADHPQHALARRQMRNGGGMISFALRASVHGGDEAAARRVVAATRIFALAESLGGVESLIELPAAMTHASVAGSGNAVEPGLIRLSVGLEHKDDLIDDLHRALGER